ncbi:MAG: hypothetical protein WCG45_01220, partial [bacterium]
MPPEETTQPETSPEIVSEVIPETPPTEIIPTEPTPAVPTEESSTTATTTSPTPSEAIPPEPEVVPAQVSEIPPTSTPTSPTTTTNPSSENHPPAPSYDKEGEISPRQTLLTTLISLRERARNVIHARKNMKLEKIMAFALLQKGKGKGQGIVVTNDDVEKLLHVSDSTATRYLEILVKEGRLKRFGEDK